MNDFKESQDGISYEKAEEIYAQFFEGYDRISTILNKLHLTDEEDKKIVEAVKITLDELDTYMYSQLLMPDVTLAFFL